MRNFEILQMIGHGGEYWREKKTILRSKVVGYVSSTENFKRIITVKFQMNVHYCN